MIIEMNKLEKIDKNIKIAPIRAIPRAYYCDFHHYNTFGYILWSIDAVAIFQQNNFDFWN
jgi:hypothetical protein